MTEQSNKVSIIKQLEMTAPAQIVNLPEVAERFKKLYVTFNGADGARFYEAEKFHFAKRLQDSPDLQKCTKLSLYGCFLDMAVNGLSFDPAMGHASIVPRKFKVYRRNAEGVNVEQYEMRACVSISGQGELIMRIQQGQIKYTDNPILVYTGDVFKTGTRNNAVFVEHEAVYPRATDAEIMACYLKIVRNDDTIDYKVLSMGEVLKIKEFSDSKNGKAWNAGLPGMIQTKTIKHAFRGYPKIRLLNKTTFTELASDQVGDQNSDQPGIDIYDLGQEIHQGDQQPAISHEPGANQPAPGSEPITAHIDVTNEDDFVNDNQPAGPGIQVEDETF